MGSSTESQPPASSWPRIFRFTLNATRMSCRTRRTLEPHQPPRPEPVARSGSAKLFGSLSNFVLHPGEQKWYVFPACCEKPAAQLGSTYIAQTESVCAVVVPDRTVCRPIQTEPQRATCRSFIGVLYR